MMVLYSGINLMWFIFEFVKIDSKTILMNDKNSLQFKTIIGI